MKYLEICIKKSRLVELYYDHPHGVKLLESQASGCTQETHGQACTIDDVDLDGGGRNCG